MNEKFRMHFEKVSPALNPHFTDTIEITVKSYFEISKQLLRYGSKSEISEAYIKAIKDLAHDLMDIATDPNTSFSSRSNFEDRGSPTISSNTPRLSSSSQKLLGGSR